MPPFDKLADEMIGGDQLIKTYTILLNGQRYTNPSWQSNAQVRNMVKRGLLPPFPPEMATMTPEQALAQSEMGTQQMPPMGRETAPMANVPPQSNFNAFPLINNPVADALMKIMGGMQGNVAEPFAAGATSGMYPHEPTSTKDAIVQAIMAHLGPSGLPVALPGTQQMERYQEWQDPMLKLGPLGIGVKGVAESVPWLGLPAAQQIGPELRAIGGLSGKLGQALAPVEALEAIPGQALKTGLQKTGQAFEKISPQVEKFATSQAGGVKVGGTAPKPSLNTPEERLTQLIKDAAVPAREETEKLYHQEMKKKVGRLATTQEAQKGKGWEGFYKEKASLGGELPKAQFEAVGSKINPEDEIYLLDKPGIYWNEQAKLGNINPRHVPLRVQTTKEALHKLVVEGLIPQERELEYLLEVYGEPLIKAILDKRSLGQKAFREVMDILGLPRAIQSSWDYSMPFRQAAILTAANPTLSLPAMWDMFRASVPMPFKKWQPSMGEHWAARMNKMLWNRENAQLYQQAGLELPSMGKYARLVSREESFQTRFANIIPGIKQSQQAAITYLNQLRADKFDQIISKWTRENYNYTPQDVKALGQYINIATGRGDVGMLKSITPFLNTMLYSSRLIASRVELPYILVKATPAVRKEIAKDLVKSAAILAGDLAFFSYILGADVQMNPRSTDFAKIKIGNTRLDMGGGYQQYLRLILQMAGSAAQQNMRTTAKTEYGQATIPQSGWESFTRWGRSKLSPAAGFLTDLMDSQNFIGQELDANKATVAREAWSRFMPFFIQDLNDAIKQEGLTGGLLAIPSAFGAGAGTYETSLYTVKTTLQAKLAHDLFNQPYEKLTDLQKKQISNNPEMKALNKKITAQEKAEKATTTTTKPTLSQAIEANKAYYKDWDKYSDADQKALNDYYIKYGKVYK